MISSLEQSLKLFANCASAKRPHDHAEHDDRRDREEGDRRGERRAELVPMIAMESLHLGGDPVVGGHQAEIEHRQARHQIDELGQFDFAKVGISIDQRFCAQGNRGRVPRSR